MANRRWKNLNLRWNVLFSDFNKNNIRSYNVLGDRFVEELHIAVNKNLVHDYNTLKQFTDNYFKYHYWSKSEYEIAVGGLLSKYPKEFEKIDAYYQLEMNLDRIVEYINNKINLNF